MQDSGCLTRLFGAGCGFVFGGSASALALLAIVALMFGDFSSMLSVATALLAAGSCGVIGGVLGAVALLQAFRRNPWRQYGPSSQ